jgi:methylmalonyl-CoA/ethylmalonyl-CoA epimerase
MDRSLTSDIRSRLGPDGHGGLVGVDGGLDLAVLADLAGEFGARFVHLDGPPTRADLIDGLARGLAFPEGSGRNWDAIEEMLGFPEDDASGPALVAWTDPGRLDDASVRTFRAIVESAVAARATSGAGPLVVIFGRGPGRDAGRTPTRDLPPGIRRLGKVHHVALIVSSIEDSLGLWRDALGLDLETVMDIPYDHVRIAFLGVGESKIELVEPTDDTTGVARFLASKGEGFHHVCFEVPNIAEALLHLEIDGIELIDTAARKGAEGPVAFLHPRSCHGVLVELIEAPGGPAWASLGY